AAGIMAHLPDDRRMALPESERSARSPHAEAALPDATASAPARPVARDWLSAIELLGLGAIWGASFLFMRVAAPEFGALALVEVRLVSGALVLAPLLWRERARLTR